MGTDNRQRGNKNLLIITNSAIIGAVEKKAITPIGSFRGMTLFDMNDGIVLARLKDKTGFITGMEDIHRIIGIEPCVQKYGTPKGNERQGYRYVFCDNNRVYSLGLKILYGFDCTNLYMDGTKWSLRNLTYSWDMRKDYMRIEPRDTETAVINDSVFIGSVNKLIAFKRFIKNGYRRDAQF